MPQISCPKCGQAYTIVPEQWSKYQGRSIACTNCAQPFSVAPAPARIPALAVATTMPAAARVRAMTSAPHPPTTLPAHQPFVPTSPARLNRPAKRVATKTVMIVLAGIAGIGIVAALAVFVFAAVGQGRETANRVNCENNLRQIGMTCNLYATDTGHFPEKLDRIVTGALAGHLAPTAFVCPSSNDTPPDGGSPQKFGADLNRAGFVSYIYVGSNLKHGKAGADAVLLYDQPEHHPEQCNIVFADNHTEGVFKSKALRMIAELNTGQNPPPAGRTP